MSGSSNNSKKDDPVPSGRDRWVASHTDNNTRGKRRDASRAIVYPPYIQWLLLLSLCASLVTHDTQ